MIKKHRLVRLYCHNCYAWYKIPVRCSIKDGLCDSCQDYRRDRFVAMCMRRAQYYHTNTNVQLWTLGTDMKDTKTNKEILYKYWRKFSMRINVYSKRIGFKYSPLVYVFESGSKGDRLHIHFLHHGFLSHLFVLNLWRSITRQKSNVNYSALDHLSVIVVIWYLAKYVSKSLERYYWLGNWRKTPPDNHVVECIQCRQSDPFIYYDTIDAYPTNNHTSLHDFI